MGSCISSSATGTSRRRRSSQRRSRRQTFNQDANASIDNSINNILNSCNIETAQQQQSVEQQQQQQQLDDQQQQQNVQQNPRRKKKYNLNNSKNRNKKLKKLNPCINCKVSNNSLSSNRSDNNERQIRTSRNYHDNNNLDLDYESSEDDDNDDDDEEGYGDDVGDLNDVEDDFISGSGFNGRRSSRETNEIVRDILNAIRAVVINNNEDEPPMVILQMQKLASDEKGWVKIMIELVNRIELNDAIGPAIISLFLDECPIPTTDSIGALIRKMPINKKNVAKHKERNCFVIFSCLGEKVAGPSSSTLMNKDILEFSFFKLKYDESFDKTSNFTKDEIATLTVMLYALIALEKFALSTENRLKIMEQLKNVTNPLIELSKWNSDNHYLKRQIGFNSQFLLDNAFPIVNHVYGYETVDTTNINVKLNDNDVSEYLKISPNGLEARNDTLSFESVRCTFQCDTGCWFYEVTVLTNGIMQIGFATKSSKFLNYNGYGIGDDEYSVGYDGCRRFIWYNADPQPHEHKAWKEGDVVGLLLDINNHKIIFYLNGEPLPSSHTKIFESAKNGFFAAASFMSFQHCMFNFGKEPFKYPPKNYKFKSFNDYGVLKDDEKVILPRKKKLDLLRNVTIKEGACSLCCDNIASVILIPCQHKDFCLECAGRLSTCPVCRSHIALIKDI